MRVRVVRVLEYTYDDLERYEKDMMQWTQTSANWGTMVMRTVGVLITHEGSDES